MRQNKERRFIGETTTQDENVLVNSLIMERMPMSYALTTHFENLVNTFGEETVKRFISQRFGMKQTKNKAA